MGPAPSLKMVFSYGLRPRLWLLVYIYVVVDSIVEAIEAHPQDSFSLPRVDRNIYVCLSRNIFRARGVQHTPMNDIFSA